MPATRVRKRISARLFSDLPAVSIAARPPRRRDLQLTRIVDGLWPFPGQKTDPEFV